MCQNGLVHMKSKDSSSKMGSSCVPARWKMKNSPERMKSINKTLVSKSGIEENVPLHLPIYWISISRLDYHRSDSQFQSSVWLNCSHSHKGAPQCSLILTPPPVSLWYHWLVYFWSMESTEYLLSYMTKWLLRYLTSPDPQALVLYMETSNNSQNRWVTKLTLLSRSDRIPFE